MDISYLEKQYEIANEGRGLSEGEQVKRNMNFIKILLSDNSPDIVNYHYDLLKRREYKDLYYDIRAAIRKRPNIEEFLLLKLKTEKDEGIQADILQLLGGLRSPHARSLARDYINHKNERHREVASFVLGWVGNKDDIHILNEHMLNEEKPLLRKTAASAHRQIASRMPEVKMAIIRSLKQGFEHEQDDEVIPWIIIMIETILIKRLGIREDKDDPYIWHGDLEKAKKKTAQFLASLDFEKK